MLEEAPNIQEATESNSIQVSSAILQNQVTIFIFIMRVSQNVSIRWEMNFYDKNTC
jgi:hypothetical protein